MNTKVKSYLALAVIAASACTSVEVYEQPDAISIVPVAEVTSLKSVSGPMTMYSPDESFVVYAYHSTSGSETQSWTEFYGDGSGINTWIDAGTFANAGNGWGGNPTPYYWPKTGHLMFAGFSPADIVAPAASGEAHAVSASYMLEATAPAFTLTGFQQGDYSATASDNKMVDLMWFNINDSGSKPVNNGISGGAVPVTFHHSLAWLTFTFKSARPDGEKFYLVNAVLSKINSKGDLQATVGGAVWSKLSQPRDYTLFASTASGDLLDEVGVVADNLLVVPADFTAVSPGSYALTLKFRQGGQDQLEQTVSFELNSLAQKSWEAGKHYTYNVSLSAEPIIFEPSVDSWPSIESDGDVSPEN